MAKRGTFGGSRFGSPTYGRTGFKRGFGRAAFSRKADLGFESGIAKDMMDFFKNMQSGKFGMGGGKPEGAQQRQPRTKTPQPEPITIKTPGYEFLTGGGATSFSTGQGINEAGAKPKTGTPKQKPVKFRPKLTRGAR